MNENFRIIMKKAKYVPLPIYSTKEEIQEVFKDGSKKDLMMLSLGVGESYPDWKYAQDVCVQLSESKDADIRANACLGFAYIARTKGAIDKDIVVPILLRELQSQVKNKQLVKDAIEDLNYRLGWNLTKI